MNKSPPHIILGIAPDASDTEIKKTFRRLAKNWHPDRYRGSKEYGEEQFKRIKDAHDTMLSQEYKDRRTDNTHHKSNPGVFNHRSTGNNQPGFRNNQFPFGVHPMNVNPQQQQSYPGYNPTARQAFPTPNGPMYGQPFNGRRPVTGSASVLCNGTVLLSGGFRPSQMTPEFLRQLQQNANNANPNGYR